MKRALLLACMLLILSGCRAPDPKCFMGDHDYWKDYTYYYDDAKITVKEGKACFSPVNAGSIPKEQVPIGFIRVFWGPKEAWVAMWGDGIRLPGDECITYGGAFPLEKNTFYLLNLSALIEQGPKPGVHAYVVVFCLSDGKDGETVVHRFPLKKFPSTCPAPEVK
jgi:hypothetical protein